MISEARLLTYGIALGAGLMYVLDPRQGGARRAVIRDKSLRALHDVEGAAELGSRDMAHRLHGAVAQLKAVGKRDHADDATIASRVRARLGHVCSHPHAVEVVGKGEGCIELKGAILTREAREVVSAVAQVRGVRAVDDDLDRYDHPGDVPGLQGEALRRSALVRLTTPAARLVVGLAAAAVGVASLIRGHPLGFVAGGAAVLALARSSTRGDRHMFSVHPPRAGTAAGQPTAPRDEAASQRSPSGAPAASPM